MNWKKSLCVAILIGAALGAMAGCSQVESTVPVASQTPSATQSSAVPAPSPTPSANQPGVAPSGQMPPSGASNNGTMPVPPGNGMPSDNRTSPPPLGFSGNGTMPGGSPPVGTAPAAQGQ